MSSEIVTETASSGEPPQRIRALAEVLLCSGVPTQMLLGSLAGLWTGSRDGVPPLPWLAGLLIADTCVLVVIMVFLMRRRGERARDLWLGSRPIAREALVGLALVPTVFMAVVVMLNVIRAAAPWLHNVAVNPFEEIAGRSGAELAVFGVVAIVAGGVREELQRAFILRRFEQHLGGAAVGAVISSVAFGLGHYLQGWDAVLTTGMLGAFWAVVYLRRRSSVSPLVCHAGFNSLEVVRLALVGA